MELERSRMKAISVSMGRSNGLEWLIFKAGEGI